MAVIVVWEYLRAAILTCGAHNVIGSWRANICVLAYLVFLLVVLNLELVRYAN